MGHHQIMYERHTTSLLGIDIDLEPLRILLERASAAVARRDVQLCFSCANPHSLVLAQADASFRMALLDSDIVVADGTGVTLMSRLVHVPIGPRITGEDYFLGLMRTLDRKPGARVFFFGSSERVLLLIRQRVQREFPNIEVCGTKSPPFRDWSPEENQAMVEMINSAKPDVVWVGMTAPKQEKWLHQNRHFLTAPVLGSIGAVFDFFAGTIRRAPWPMRKLGLEWLYRLSREPRRMWRRNIVSAPVFVWLVLREHLLSARWRKDARR
jgi:N-acetylglucosaminyldiphosphoundecaprenol N-acetyl-beta-D-mannosaminyltransferase